MPRILINGIIVAHLEITTYIPCINNCGFCPQEGLAQSYKGDAIMTFEIFKEILLKIPKDVQIHFSGFSEPFGNRESALMMKYAYDQGYEIVLYTTLAGLTEEDVEILKGIHFKKYVLHLPDDTNLITDEKEWVKSSGLFRQIAIEDEAIYHIGNLSKEIADLVPHARKEPILNRANNVDSGVAPPVDRIKGDINCWVSGNRFNQNVLLPNGDVVLCCMDFGLKHKLGNLFKNFYDELMISPEIKQIKKSLKDESIDSLCRYCVR